MKTLVKKILMPICPKCNTDLLNHARFCHVCGTEAISRKAQCLHCGVVNVPNAKFCSSCGEGIQLPAQYAALDAQFTLDFTEQKGEFTDQIKAAFFKALQARVKEESKAELYTKYLEVFQLSGFHHVFDKKTRIAIQTIKEHTYSVPMKRIEITDYILENHFDDLLDRFMIEHTQELNEFTMPESILQYQNRRRSEVNLSQMIFDYLDFANEKETIFTDFSAMPVKKLRNACSSFLFPSKDEPIFVICDQTVFGSCKEGFAFTEQALYWKAHFEAAQKVMYNNIFSIEKGDAWIKINDLYFHVNPTVNRKVMKLMKKLRNLMR